jgi:hypothetical protein
MKIDKKRIDSIYDEVLLPIQYIINTDIDMQKLNLSEEHKNKRNIEIVKLTLTLTKNNNSLIETTMKSFVSLIKDTKIDKAIIECYVGIFFDLYRKWLIKNNLNHKNFDAKRGEIYSIFHDIYENYEPEVIEDDEFWDIDAEDVDSEINQIHYSEEEKIDAKTFMLEGSIDKDDIDEIQDALNDFDNIKFENQFLSQKYITQSSKVLRSFVKIFNVSYEFKTLGYGIESLIDLLYYVDNKYINSLEEHRNEMIKMLINGIVEDLEKFNQEIFINQNTPDIHYLDASLISDVSYIKSVLEGKE